MFARVVALGLLVGCYQSTLVENDAGTDATPTDVAIDAPRITPSIEGRFGSLVGARYEGETWLIASARDPITAEALPLHLYRPDYSGESVRFGEPVLVPGTTGWDIIAAARWQDTVALVLARGDMDTRLNIYNTRTQAQILTGLGHEGSGRLTARIAMVDETVYMTTSWGLVREQLFQRLQYGEDGISIREATEIGTDLGVVPVAVVDGEPRLLVVRDQLTLVTVQAGGTLRFLRELRGQLPAFAGIAPLALERNGSRELLVDNEVVGIYPEASQINGHPSAQLRGEELVVALGLGDSGGISWVYRRAENEPLNWNTSPADGLAGWHVAHLGQGHAGVFYIDTPLGARLPQIRYDGVRTE